MNGKRICIAKITKPRGLKGEVRITSYTDSHLSTFQNIILSTGEKVDLVNIKKIEEREYLAFLTGVNDRTTAESFVNKYLYVFRSDLPALRDDEYYFEDLVECKVEDQNSILQGVVSGVFDYGAGAFIELTLNSGRLATIPFNKNSIISVNIVDKIIVIDKTFIIQ
ncbi:MAG: 16S rRNA processing protein RimM [Alphaproteobacteria bacterium]|nr:16S rRNA processing protein RimM [Alphaproteobacteria bacterium]